MSLRLFLPLFGVLVVDFVCFFVSCFLPLCSWIICLCCHFFCLSNCFLWLSDVFVSLWGFFLSFCRSFMYLVVVFCLVVWF